MASRRMTAWSSADAMSEAILVSNDSWRDFRDLLRVALEQAMLFRVLSPKQAANVTAAVDDLQRAGCTIPAFHVTADGRVGLIWRRESGDANTVVIAGSGLTLVRRRDGRRQTPVALEGACWIQQMRALGGVAKPDERAAAPAAEQVDAPTMA